MSRRWGPGVNLPRRWSDADLMGPAAHVVIAANKAKLAEDRASEGMAIVMGHIEQQARERKRLDLADRIAAWRRGPRR